jgi:hypothetical protein
LRGFAVALVVEPLAQLARFLRSRVVDLAKLLDLVRLFRVWLPVEGIDDAGRGALVSNFFWPFDFLAAGALSFSTWGHALKKRWKIKESNARGR